MQIHQDYQWLDPNARGASVAMGNFDGVHLGHRSVIDRARDRGPLGIITFEPHPRQFFAPDAPPFRLMNAEARANRLAKLGVEHLFQLPFNRALAALTPEDFARVVLAEGLGISHVVVGSDFCFGKGRAGTAPDLRRLGERFGFTTTIAPLVAIAGREVSSTAIRLALTEGRPRDAADMLGHLHRIEGEVIHGDKRGRTIGVPTANIRLGDYVRPKYGVYAITARLPDGRTFDGVANLGIRPMFEVSEPLLEAWLFDFDEDLYGQVIEVELTGFIREEMSFDSLEALKAQIEDDAAKARWWRDMR